jgi:hypothetical protein
VSHALQLTGGPDVLGTVIFTSMFDSFFDMLNVGSFEMGARNRKKFSHPYRTAKDFRLVVSTY